MADFSVQIRRDYRDLTGLVLDLRSDGLFSVEGTHDGPGSSAELVDSSASWPVDSLVGKVVMNVAESSYGRITANTATTVTAALDGGLTNLWNPGDAYTIQADANGVLRWPNAAPVVRVGGKAEYSGVHDGGTGSSLVDSSRPWAGLEGRLVGLAVYNLDDGSSGWITNNTADTVFATLTFGAFDNWEDGDRYVIAAPRLGDAIQSNHALQPAIRTVDGYRLADFADGKGGTLDVEAGSALVPYPRTWWTMAIEKWNGGAGSTKHALVSFHANDFTTALSWWRKYSSVQTIYHGYSITGPEDQPDGLWVAQSVPGGNPFLCWRNGASYAVSGTANQPKIDAIVGGFIASIGRFYDVGADMYGFPFYGRIRSLRIWDRLLSPIEVDFVHKSLASDGTNFGANSRPTVLVRVWTDETGDWSRVTRQQAAPQRFVIATTDGKARLQIAAAIGGRVLPDTEFAYPFRIAFLETPGFTPRVVQDSGWSSVFDVEIDAAAEGHYSAMITHQAGGGVIVHFDVEAAA